MPAGAAMLIGTVMTTFLFTLLLSFVVVVAVMFLVSYCKGRRSGKHGLTGMCHKSGGAACCSCSEAGQALPRGGAKIPGRQGR